MEMKLQIKITVIQDNNIEYNKHKPMTNRGN